MKLKFIITVIVVALVSSMIGGVFTYNAMKLSNLPTSKGVQKVDNNSSKVQNVYQYVAEKASPSVVGIVSKGISTDNPFTLPQEVTDSGTGFIVDKNGYILTNAHVVGNGNTKDVQVIYNHGKTTKGKVLYFDNTVDIAIVKINAKDLVPAELGNSDNVKIGDIAIAIGNPLGTELMSTVTQGIISGLDRTVQTNTSSMSSLIQTDASINPGNSGGPLLNKDGQVIGINTVKANADNLGFAIPINEAKIIVENVIKNNNYKVTQFGIKGIDVSKLSVEFTNGVYIKDVVPNSIASGLNIKPGDILVDINNTKVKNIGDLRKFFYNYNGEKLTVKVLRYHNDKYKEVTLN